jgi:hypothetical protein
VSLPDRINSKWIATLDDAALVQAERQLHVAFNTLEREQKRILGARYQMMRSPDALLAAWQRWSIVNNAVRSRRLMPAYRPTR